MEAVDVLAGVDSFDDALLVDVLRQGELDDEAMHLGVVIQALDLAEQTLFGDVILEADQGGAEAHLGAGLDLSGYIGLAAAVMADEDSYQVRGFFASCDASSYFGCDLLLDLSGGCFTIEELVGLFFHWGSTMNE